MRLSGQFQICLFFLGKGFECKKKHQNANQTTITHLKVSARIKNVAFLA